MARALRLLAVAALLVGLGVLAGFTAALLRPRRTVTPPGPLPPGSLPPESLPAR